MFYSSDDLIMAVIRAVNRTDIKDQYIKKYEWTHIDIVLFSPDKNSGLYISYSVHVREKTVIFLYILFFPILQTMHNLRFHKPSNIFLKFYLCDLLINIKKIKQKNNSMSNKRVSIQFL